MTTRTRVKIVAATNGCHRYLIVSGQLPILLSKSRYRTVGDAKSAGKAKLRVLGRVDGPLPIQMRGLCIECLYHGVERRAAKIDNADRPSVLCRSCHQQRHPGHLDRAGVL